MEQSISARKASPRRINAGTHRRSTNACRYCKRRKIKCHYNSENSQRKCVACSRASTECFFDVPPDGVLRNDAYVATLEARIQSLESQLRESKLQQPEAGLTPETTCSEPQVPERNGETVERITQATQLSGQESFLPNNVSRPEITIMEMVYGRAFVPGFEEDALPALPSSSGARKLVDAAYFYTQASPSQIPDRQVTNPKLELLKLTLNLIGAFFIWIIYAIGARLIPDPENATDAYFARARIYLPAVMALQDLSTVQALLCLVQYYFRAPTESPIWHIVGLSLRLCVKLRYHRKIASSPEAQKLDPYKIELRKRFFWCAYCFDRSLSILTKLPFGISDSDIDAETPVDIDDTCIDQQRIRELQMRQAAGDSRYEEGTITTMTAALHHLHVYRIRSKILTRFTGPHAQVPSLVEVQALLCELDHWKQQAPPKQDSRPFPQQTPDRVQATYTQAVLLLIRPILMANVIDPDLIGLCVEFAVDACQDAKILSLNPHTPPDRVTVYHCFYCGVTLLQCLAIKPTALTPRRAHQAISACLSALAVYTRVLPAVAPFLRLFEDLSNLLVCDDHEFETHPSHKLRTILNRIVSSDPSEAPGILHSLSNQETQQATFGTSSETLEMEQMAIQYNSILGGQSSVVLGTNFPLDMPLDFSPLYAPDAETADLWIEPWLHLSSANFS
ncbi:hypothetical protein N7499_012728 [Penicillium canescens]|nr:hypothetical protein N7444_002538 [Penicillium canescens]KAJ6064048.1 hypothetical protein N7499_012728 [Penicillium canescens]KAJ6154456.1 hypothetical protein N7485_012825 [Penicillium canescens]